MKTRSLCVCLLMLLCTVSAHVVNPHFKRMRHEEGSKPYVVKTIEHPLDHFNHMATERITQRFLLNDTIWSRNGGADKQNPIFVFTGAEGGNVEDVFWDYGSYSNMFFSLHGMTVYVEHRYFGESFPFNNNKNTSMQPDKDHVGYLSIEQGARDTLAVITHIRHLYNAWNCPVYTFGGSLGGTLATLARLRYPHAVQGAVVSSTPLLGYINMTGMDQFSWSARVTKTYEVLSEGCPDIVRRGFAALLQSSDESIADVFNICEKPSSQSSGTVYNMVFSTLQGGAEFAYPFSESSIPTDCQSMFERSKISDLQIFTDLIQIPERPACLNLTAYNLAANTPDAQMWIYLACTEVMHRIGYNNVTDMFPPSNWTVRGMDEYCGKLFPGVRVSPTEIPTIFGLYHVSQLAAFTSHVLFTYGTADPWATQGVSSGLSPTLPVLWVANGTHCADILPPSPSDTPAMLSIRLDQQAILSTWIVQHQRLLKMKP